MGSSVSAARRVAHRVFPEIEAPAMAKANLRKAEMLADYRTRVAKAVTVGTAHLQLKELQHCIEQATGHCYDERQLARWKSGAERPHFDALFAVPGLKRRLLVAFMENEQGVQIETVIRMDAR